MAPSSPTSRKCAAPGCENPPALAIQRVPVCAAHAQEIADYARAMQMLDEPLDEETIREFLGAEGR